ncbi:MAG: peptidoglycan DD-metalloendopeptidase family protein [Chloroflexi bacterium]|nr:peptidoglycan DD-metalloendopeptidase family protein [Chloroflexota bacterium]
MKNVLEKIRSLFNRKPKDAPADKEPSTKPRARKVDRFAIVSWVATIFVVVALLGSTIYYKNSRPASYTPVPAPTSPAGNGSGAGQPNGGGPVTGSGGSGASFILRKLQLKTNIPARPRYESVIYRVVRGDAMMSIAEQFNIKYESILYINKQMEDNPHSLKPGMELIIPPVDGLYYEWKEGDTFESVAEKFYAEPEGIINFPGNKVDLTDPKIEPGTTVMIPGGSRELRNWAADLQTMARGANTGTGGANAGNICGGGPVASGLGWPADDHTLSGNPYGPGHLGIDIAAPEGSNVYAAGSGVVTQAQGGWNYGYGNVIQIDHGNGYVTVYAHLSQINVTVCSAVGQGALIGYSGNTGNSFGAHLHFEIRLGGTNINPYDIVQ